MELFSFSFDIEECKNCECDKLTHSTSYGFLPFNSPLCVRRTSRYQEARNIQRGDANPAIDQNVRDIWFRFVSDDTVFYKGFNLSYIVKSSTRKLIPFLFLFLVDNNSENFKLWNIILKVKKQKYCLNNFFHLIKFNHRPDSGSSKHIQKLLVMSILLLLLVPI